MTPSKAPAMVRQSRLSWGWFCLLERFLLGEQAEARFSTSGLL